MSELEKVELNDAEVKKAVGGLGIGSCKKDSENFSATKEYCNGCDRVSRVANGSSYQCKCGNGIPGIWLERK